jgi:hypothetical protein
MFDDTNKEFNILFYFFHLRWMATLWLWWDAQVAFFFN